MAVPVENSRDVNSMDMDFDSGKPFGITHSAADFVSRYHDPCLDESLFPALPFSPASDFPSTDLRHDSSFNSLALPGSAVSAYQTGFDPVTQQINNPEVQAERNSPKANPGTLKCTQCLTFTAKTKRDLTRHIKCVHQKTDEFHCDEPGCPRSRKGKGWARVDLRNRHIRKRHGREKGPNIDARSNNHSMSPASDALTDEHSPGSSQQESVDQMRRLLQFESDLRARAEEEVRRLKQTVDVMKQTMDMKDTELREAREKLSRHEGREDTCWKILQRNYDGGKAQAAVHARCCQHGNALHDSGGDRYLPSPGT